MSCCAAVQDEASLASGMRRDQCKDVLAAEDALLDALSWGLATFPGFNAFGRSQSSAKAAVLPVESQASEAQSCQPASQEDLASAIPVASAESFRAVEDLGLEFAAALELEALGSILAFPEFGVFDGFPTDVDGVIEELLRDTSANFLGVDDLPQESSN